MSARRRFGLLAVGVALGAGLVVLPAMAAPDAVGPVEAIAAGVEADPQPVVLPVPVEAVKPDVPVAPPVPWAEPVQTMPVDDGAPPVVPGDSVYVPSTGDCGEGAYRIEPGVCEWDVPRVEEDDPGWDCRTMGNRQCGVMVGGAWYVLDFGAYTFAERG